MTVALQQRLPAIEISFDAYSRLTARSTNRHPCQEIMKIESIIDCLELL